MALSRRQFVILGTSSVAAAAAGCDDSQGHQHGGTAATAPTRSATTAATTANPGELASPAPDAAPSVSAFDAGPASEYANDGVYDAFRADGFFIVRRGPQLAALSSVCTHKGCKVRAQPDRSYVCKCHGSRFDPDGKVINPPARRDLPRLDVSVNDAGRVLVRLPVKRGGDEKRQS